MIIQKFGGTSVANAIAMRAVLSIVQRDISRRPIVVLSACSGATNDLIALVEYAAKGDRNSVQKSITAIRERHLALCRELIYASDRLTTVVESINVLCTELSVYCEGVALLGECTPRSIAYSSAMGELLSSTIFAAYAQSEGIPAVFADARKFMRTDDTFLGGVVDRSALRILAEEYVVKPLLDGGIIITQGFIGSDSIGRTTTLGRGGSDYSAALLGAAIHAEEIQIWTDVSGIASTDPRRIASAFTIPFMSFAEARELAYYGAKVLHPETILPAVEMGITVKVLNTFAPENEGTTILPHNDKNGTGFRGITMKEHCLHLTLAVGPNESASVINQSLHVLEQHGYPLYAMLSSEGNCIVLTTGNDEHVRDLLEVSGVRVQIQPCDMLCVVGPNVRSLSDAQLQSNVALCQAALSQGILSIMFGHSPVGIIIITSLGEGKEMLTILHKVLHTLTFPS